MMKNWKDVLVAPNVTILEAMKIIDETTMQFVAVVDDDMRLLGTVTDGDIRRAILKGTPTEELIEAVMNRNPKTLASELKESKKQRAFVKTGLNQVPIINEDRQVVSILFNKTMQINRRKNKVILMAGGLGTRLHPLTKDTPKPMLPIGGKPILELIIEHFKQNGFYDFIISVNYKKEVIQNYFQDGSFFGVNISYIEENKRLGTAGALSLIEKTLEDPFFVMNGDILTNFNCVKMLEQHIENEAIATMAVREYEYQIPYGVIETDGVHLIGIKEKPTHKSYVNAGIYILSSDILQCIPTDEFYDMPTLFEQLIKEQKDTVVYPIQNYWLDIGQLEDYEQAKGVKL